MVAYKGGGGEEGGEDTKFVQFRIVWTKRQRLNVEVNDLKHIIGMHNHTTNNLKFCKPQNYLAKLDF